MLQINKKWVYVIVRADIPLAHQIVQSNHASFEAGLKYNQNLSETSSLIVLTVKNKIILDKEYKRLENLGFNLTKFNEPSWNYGFTSFASEPISNEERKYFKNLQLWKGKEYVL